MGRKDNSDQLREELSPRRGLLIGGLTFSVVVIGVIFALLAVRVRSTPQRPRAANLPPSSTQDLANSSPATAGATADGLVGPLSVPDGGWPEQPRSLETMDEVPAGTVLQGSISEDAEEDETPAGEVRLSAFYIDRYEITNEAYAECVAAGVCRPPRELDVERFGAPRQPVVGVNWYDATNFCRWAGKRLPTEAEWERAARGDDRRIYPWGDDPPNCAHALSTQCDRYGPAEIGGRPQGAGPYGTQDLAGNVWEWVADWYAPRYYPSGPEGDPTGPPAGQQRVLRGGSWHFGHQHIRAANRHRDIPIHRTPWYGFRCAYSPPPPPPLTPTIPDASTFLQGDQPRSLDDDDADPDVQTLPDAALDRP